MPNNVLHTRPYLFDRHFEEEAEYSGQDGSSTRPPPKQNNKKAKRFLDEEDLKKAREDARNETIHELENSEQRRLTEACEAITDALTNNEAALSEIKSEITQQCIALSLAISNKLLANITNSNNIAVIESLVLSIVPSILDAGRIKLRVNQDIAGKLQEILEPSIRASGYSQSINVVPDQNMTGSDCILEWPGGGASRNQRETWQNLKRIIETVTEQSLDGFDDTKDTEPHGEHDPHSKSSA